MLVLCVRKYIDKRDICNEGEDGSSIAGFSCSQSSFDMRSLLLLYRCSLYVRRPRRVDNRVPYGPEKFLSSSTINTCCYLVGERKWKGLVGHSSLERRWRWIWYFLVPPRAIGISSMPITKSTVISVPINGGTGRRAISASHQILGGT